MYFSYLRVFWCEDWEHEVRIFGTFGVKKGVLWCEDWEDLQCFTVIWCELSEHFTLAERLPIVRQRVAKPPSPQTTPLFSAYNASFPCIQRSLSLYATPPFSADKALILRTQRSHSPQTTLPFSADKAPILRKQCPHSPQITPLFSAYKTHIIRTQCPLSPHLM